MALESQRKSGRFYKALAKPGLSIIGEFKKASPSMGVIDGKIDLMDRIDQYNASVDCISVLTEEDYFNGGADDLKSKYGSCHPFRLYVKILSLMNTRYMRPR